MGRSRLQSFRGLSACWILLFALALSGCSTFNREWKAAARTPLPLTDIQGRWDGTWLSDVNGHTGRLRCLLSKAEDRHFQARFKATYWKILRYSYTADLLFEPADGSFKLSGDTDLGWWAGGLYHYEGSVSSTNFFATYKNKYDHGTFRMSRPSQ